MTITEKEYRELRKKIKKEGKSSLTPQEREALEKAKPNKIT
mgnify:CR=1 FL=1